MQADSIDAEWVFQDEYEYIDVVWLKRDVRWADHGPLAEVDREQTHFCTRQNHRKFVILYLYEPDQLKEPTVHGSHVRFVHEGLIDMEVQLKQGMTNTVDSDVDRKSQESFKYLTVCHNTIIDTLTSIHFRYQASSIQFYCSSKPVVKRKFYKIARLLAHEETGHWQSYMRDRSVRKWCKTRSIPFIEFNQTGVTRRLKDRDDYLKRWKEFMSKPVHPSPNFNSRSSNCFRARLVQLKNLPGFLSCPDGISNLFAHRTTILENLPNVHRGDRPGRQQYGGETRAMETLRTFLSERGSTYAQGISSPNSSWNSCSRLSPYLTWGHISLRSVLKALEERREILRIQKSKGGVWLKSLQAFSSRAHWRSHFIQKLESEPTLEKVDLCPSYQHLRRQEGDWDPAKYRAWVTGTTGYPFVDACMRCLMEHGWINFRMRAMLVSFATYNLWLDWKKIAPHLARVFLDYEPGIHYPQLQMQAGTTGINAMRVYNVTKQAKDQDPKGIFIRKYVPELRLVPDQFIHEPWKMSEAMKKSCFNKSKNLVSSATNQQEYLVTYPNPIVDEKESARIAKAKLNAVKKQMATRIQANQVYLKHGSRSHQSNAMNGRISGDGALSAAVEVLVYGKNEGSRGSRQPNIREAFAAGAMGKPKKKANGNSTNGKCKGSRKREIVDLTKGCKPNQKPEEIQYKQLKFVESTSQSSSLCSTHILKTTSTGNWNCSACTFLNKKPNGVVCAVCGTPR